MELQNQNLGLLSRAHLEDVLDDFDQAALYQFHVEPHYGQYVLNLVRVRVGVQRADGIPIDWDEFYEWLSTRRCCQHCRRASGGVEAVIRRSTSLNNWQYWRSDRRTGSPMMYMDWLSHANTWAHGKVAVQFDNGAENIKCSPNISCYSQYLHSLLRNSTYRSRLASSA